MSRNRFPRGKRGGQKNRPKSHQSTQSDEKKNPILPSVKLIPRRLKPYERFFAALLRSSPEDYVKSASDSSTADRLWTAICARLGRNAPTEPIQSKYSTPEEHFQVREALVLEESRHCITEALAKRWKSNATSNNIPKQNRVTMTCRCQAEESDNQTGHVIMKFQLDEQNQFTKEQLFHLRHAGVFELFPCGFDRGIEGVSLGCIVSGGSREDFEKNSCLTVMVFREPNFVVHGAKLYWVTPLCGLISEFRQYEACSSRHAKNISFVEALMGHWPKYKRFEYSDDEVDDSEDGEGKLVGEENELIVDENSYDEEDCSVLEKGDDSDDERPELDGCESPSYNFNLPELNPTQEEAAQKFLESRSGTITLVQGPPGT